MEEPKEVKKEEVVPKEVETHRQTEKRWYNVMRKEGYSLVQY
jgi:hypothetical protein